MDPVVIGLTFLAIFVVELPDKTFLATLVLATKYRPILVWIGVSLAFLVQTLVAVLLGHAVSFLPDDVVHAVAGVIFLVGAVILIREGRSHQAQEGEEIETKDVHGLRAVLASFVANRELRSRLRRAAGRAAEQLPRWRDTALALRATLSKSR